MLSDHFSVTTAIGLVLGGIAAFVLATVIALGGYGRPGHREASPRPVATAGASSEAEVEYPLDTSEH